MAKLYPPYIEGTLPAFYGEIKIPFIMNKTVGKNEINGFQLMIRKIDDNSIIEVIFSNDIDWENNIVIFTPASSIIKKGFGLYYKVQLAYIGDKNEVGYYSTIGVIKKTKIPIVKINDLSSNLNTINNNKEIFEGKYFNEDSTEKVYSYCFKLYDNTKNIIYTSEEQLHNSESNTSDNETIDTFKLDWALQENQIYFLQYQIITINGLIGTSPLYKITNTRTIDPYLRGELIATLNRDNAYVNLQIIGNKTAAGEEETVAGTFRIIRASSENNFANWETIVTTTFYNETPSKYTWKDFAVSHGHTYRYAIQQFNKYNFYSNKKYATDVEVYFDDCFLYDGKRQLKIKYNPKISSFKQNILEQKTNTIGAKYPYISRNGYVSYKEFPISGLISYLSDEENLFMTDEELGLYDPQLARQSTKADADWLDNLNVEYLDSEKHNFKLDNSFNYKDTHRYMIENSKIRTTNLVDYNITAERNFKLQVLDFLTNGTPKLFKSPEEGNYIVYLMNSSLAPNDTVGRMLHTFSTTATEIENYDYNGLRTQGIVSTLIDGTTTPLQHKKYKLKDLFPIKIFKTNELSSVSIGKDLNKVRIEGTSLPIGLSIDENIILGNEYYQDFNNKTKEIIISLPNDFDQSKSVPGEITLYYNTDSSNEFENIKNGTYHEVVVEQFNGNQKRKESNILDILNTNNKTVTKIYSLTFIKYWKMENNEQPDYKIIINDRIISPMQNTFIIDNPGEVYRLIIPKDIVLEISYQYMEVEKDE